VAADRFDRLAGDIVDGRALDWDTIEAQSDPAERGLLAELRVVATVAAAVDRLPSRAVASATLVGVAGIALLVSSVTLEREISVWQQAADLRDRVLVEARASMADGRCATARFVNVPDAPVTKFTISLFGGKKG